MLADTLAELRPAILEMCDRLNEYRDETAVSPELAIRRLIPGGTDEDYAAIGRETRRLLFGLTAARAVGPDVETTIGAVWLAMAVQLGHRAGLADAAAMLGDVRGISS